jgi:general nucleoside transport system permease protein
MTSAAASGATTLLAQTLRMMVPYGCAALGGVWSERSGVVNIALEGILLFSGFATVAVQVATGSALLGLAGGVAMGAALGAVHATAVAWQVDAIVSGIAINLTAAGATRFLLRALYGSSSNSPGVAGFSSLATGAGSGALLLRTLAEPLFVLATLCTIASSYVLYRTRLGIHVRACGENPHAAASVGIDATRLRLLAVSLGGAITGVGGAALAYDQHQFQSGMSGGRGFIALAAVIVSGWRPGRAALACSVFAALDALQILLQGETRVPHDLLSAVPYAATLLALVAMGAPHRAREAGRTILGQRPPAALGKRFVD